MAVLFKKTQKLEMKMDEFLDMVSQAGMAFCDGIEAYLHHNGEQFEDHFANIRRLEGRADVLRKEIEQQLYSETLIPESRGDVLALLENTDNVIDRAKEVMTDISVEQPELDSDFHEEFQQVSEYATQALEEMVSAIRNFLRNPIGVRDYLHKVYYYEKEADKIADRLKRKIFSSSIDLSQKLHLRDFAHHIDSIADLAEDVADRLAIYTIKRSV
ncbi:MAG: DUF47 family protein [Candidatus Neomarinimicrobiota bacterium]|nr:MAG: DUF47 family protein [Candidatus Neomarinimicrobiota bacterium]